MRKIAAASTLTLLMLGLMLITVNADTGDTPVVNFSKQAYTVKEDAGSTVVTVTLEPALSTTATVDYATFDGTAISGTDYLSTYGILTFTPGITLQTFTISILDDTLPEVDETLILSLSHPSPGTLGVYATAVLTITDDGDPYLIYLPYVTRRWPPIPYNPALNPINNTDGDGAFIVSWVEQSDRLSDSYILQEATDAAFTAGLRQVCETSSQQCPVTGRLHGTYFYRVMGKNVWGQSEWSNIQSTTVLLPGTPILYGISNEDHDGNYTVEWAAAVRATSYQLQEDTNPEFNNPTIIYEGSLLSFNVTNRPSGVYYYRVMAVGPTGTSEWSNIHSSTVLPPDAPILYDISNEDHDGNYTVSWSSAARATEYTIEEDDDPAFASPITRYNGALQTWSISNQPYGTYYYRVIATGPTGQSEPSNTHSATVTPPPPGVSVLNNHTTYSSSSSYRYVVGEVYNNTDSYLSFVKVAVNFWDGTQLVETDYTYTHLWDVHPYEKTCFLIMANNPPTWTHYTFEPVSYWSDGEARPNLTVTTHSGGLYGSSYYRLIGQIRNDEPSQIRYVTALATLYDSMGKVLECDFSYVNSTHLNPGQVSSFEIFASPPSPSAVTSYRLQTDGSR